MNIHPQSRTTPQIRAEINDSDLSQRNLADKYNISRSTVCKWKKRKEMIDLSHRPHNLQTQLTQSQEAVVVELRRSLLLPLDDLVVITREFIHKGATRSGIHRTLVRNNVSNLNELKKLLNNGEGEKKKNFKDYAPGFVHIDIKYLPKMQDEDSRTYLLVAIDRATRWVYLDIYPDKSANSAQKFLADIIENAPFKINKILTDNGKEFTDRFIPNGEREPTGKHMFDKLCNRSNIEHRLIKPAHPQTNGMVERFNGRISGILKTTKFASSKELKQAMKGYMQVYNYNIPQRNIGHLTPMQMMQKWHEKEPSLFKSLDYDLTGPDTY